MQQKGFPREAFFLGVPAGVALVGAMAVLYQCY
jgi:hypothetical protein